MENTNSYLGKIDKKACYLNHGQYGYYLTHNKVNYKIPDWFPHDKMDIDVAERLIQYKKKISQEWLEKTAPKQSNDANLEDEQSSESSDVDSDYVKDRINKKFRNKDDSEEEEEKPIKKVSTKKAK